MSGDLRRQAAEQQMYPQQVLTMISVGSDYLTFPALGDALAFFLVGKISFLRLVSLCTLGLIPFQQTLPEPMLHARTCNRCWTWRGAQELLVLLRRNSSTDTANPLQDPGTQREQ